MSATELLGTDIGRHELGTPPGDQNGGSERIRRFLVDSNTKFALRDADVPKVGDQHPDFAELKCVGRSVEDAPGTSDHSVVLCRYEFEPFRQERSASFQTVTVTVPTVFETFVTPAGAPAGTPAQRVQEIQEVHVTETRTVIQRKVKLTQYNQTIIAQMEAQNNVIHLFGGRPMRCEVGDISPVAPELWEVTYSWYSDPGTPKMNLTKVDGAGNPVPASNPIITGPPGNQTGLHYPPDVKSFLPVIIAGYADPKRYTRSPFHEVTVILHPIVEPEFVQFSPYRVDQNGWQSLPGGPTP